MVFLLFTKLYTPHNTNSAYCHYKLLSNSYTSHSLKTSAHCLPYQYTLPVYIFLTIPFFTPLPAHSFLPQPHNSSTICHQHTIPFPSFPQFTKTHFYPTSNLKSYTTIKTPTSTHTTLPITNPPVHHLQTQHFNLSASLPC